MNDFHGLPRGAFVHACFRSAVIHGLIPGVFSVRLFSVNFCMNFFAGPFLHVLFRSQGFFCINFRKAYTVGSFPVAFSVLSFPGVVSLRSLTGDVLVVSVLYFSLAFLCGAFFRAVLAEGFPCAFLEPLVSCALF